MSAPLDFLRLFRERLRAAGIRFALTSGMACVHYGLQQNTKDSDWLVSVDDLSKLRSVLSALEAESPAWQVNYRSVFGAPLEPEYMAHGWTSHLLVTEPDGTEQKVDLFGKPPRVSEWEAEADGFATRHVVALMKRTDRDKDWPHVDSLGAQMAERGDRRGVLHLQTPDWLAREWARVAAAELRAELSAQRPLLTALDSAPAKLKRFLLLERLLWEAVDTERYRVYQQAWKTALRGAPERATVLESRPFAWQHEQVVRLCRDRGLAADPLGTAGREELLKRACEEVLARIPDATPDLAAVQPPMSLLLP